VSTKTSLDLAYVIAGHSHLRVFGVPLKSSTGSNALVAVEGKPRVEVLTGAWPRTLTYWNGAIAASTILPVAVVWRGNQHNVDFLFAPTPMIDLVLEKYPQLPVDSRQHIVPELAIRELYKPSLVGLDWVLARMQKTRGPGAFVVGTPPPKQDSEALRSAVFTETHFARRFTRVGVCNAEVQLSPPLLRLKLWLLLQQMMSEHAQAFGAHFCSSPPEAQTAEGFLHEDFWATDVTHANRAYGPLMLQTIASCVSAFAAERQVH
jgi:hypothetical protein